MERANATPVIASSEARRKAEWEQNKRKIFTAIIGHHSLSSTLQLIAEAFVALCPSKAIAILLLAGEQFEVGAEAGLPKRPVGSASPVSKAGAQFEHLGRMAILGFHDSGARSCPAFCEIMESGVKLCLALPLIAASEDATGGVAVFDHDQGLLDDPARDAIQSVCDLARLAVAHWQLYDEVIHLAQYDLLTGLPNRFLLEDRLGQAMVSATGKGSLIAVCCLDLDCFKQIINCLGREFGNASVKAVSERLQASIREIDILGRLDGNEFVLVLCDLTQPSHAANICNRLIKDLTVPLVVDGHSMTITASIGVSVFPLHGDTADLLMRNADMAVQAAKRASRGHVQVYSPALGRETRRGAEMAEALIPAVAQGQFRLAYQPIYTMDREIAGFEALLRWKHPKWGRIRPAEFIPIAERTGLVVDIGDWVIAEVCRQAMEWDAAGVPQVKMFVNVSGVQLGRANFGPKVAEALERSGLAPGRLELEITESWIIADLREVAGKLRKLRNLGIGIAIDDFGTGHSTFSYLEALPLDTIKIDRSFIHRLDGSAVNLFTIRAITGLARQLGLKTVAEGVENEEHLIQLSEIGCDLVQGFFLARPRKPQTAGQLLKRQQTSASKVRRNATPPLVECFAG
jgi:diguanylate cyclase (GGDEF)-like protein